MTAENVDLVRSDAQKKDKLLCEGFSYFITNYLTTSNIVEATYAGFESTGYCQTWLNKSAPKTWDPDFKLDLFKCDLDDSGYYTPVCRAWYRL